MEIKEIRKTCRVIEPIRVSVIGITDETDDEIIDFAHAAARETRGFPGHNLARTNDGAVVVIYRD